MEKNATVIQFSTKFSACSKNPKLQNETKQAKIMPRSFSRHIRLVAIIVYS